MMQDSVTRNGRKTGRFRKGGEGLDSTMTYCRHPNTRKDKTREHLFVELPSVTPDL
jgi:hypothetical protein